MYGSSSRERFECQMAARALLGYDEEIMWLACNLCGGQPGSGTEGCTLLIGHCGHLICTSCADRGTCSKCTLDRLGYRV